MKKVFVLLIVCLVVSSPAFAAVYFVDSTTGDNADDGTTMDDAWNDIEQALEGGTVDDDDTVFVRRVHQEWDGGNPTSDISCDIGAAPWEPVKVIGWPRSSTTLTSTDWTNGSTSVNADAGTTIDREKHQGRFVTGPDGYDYLITDSTDGDGGSFTIDREYAGSDSSNQSATVKADEGLVPWVDDMGTEYGFDDSGWTIQESDWDSDADDLPVIDFGDQGYQIFSNMGGSYYYANLELRESTDGYGLIQTKRNGFCGIYGCLFYNDNSSCLLCPNSDYLVCQRVILEGSGSGATQFGFRPRGAGSIAIYDSAIYNTGDVAFYVPEYSYSIWLENVNLCVEAVCGDNVIHTQYSGAFIKGRDVKYDDTNGFWPQGVHRTFYSVENHQKVLGSHITKDAMGSFGSVKAGDGGDYPNKRSGGADYVLEVINDEDDAYKGLRDLYAPGSLERMVHEYEVTGGESWSCKYYVQYHDDDDGGNTLTADNIFLEAEYVVSYDDTSEYVITKVQSDETITDRDDADDWDQYLEIDSITPATDSKIRVRLYVPFYHADDKIYVDPLAVVGS